MKVLRNASVQEGNVKTIKEGIIDPSSALLPSVEKQKPTRAHRNAGVIDCIRLSIPVRFCGTKPLLLQFHSSCVIGSRYRITVP